MCCYSWRTSSADGLLFARGGDLTTLRERNHLRAPTRLALGTVGIRLNRRFHRQNLRHGRLGLGVALRDRFLPRDFRAPDLGNRRGVTVLRITGDEGDFETNLGSVRSLVEEALETDLFTLHDRMACTTDREDDGVADSRTRDTTDAIGVDTRDRAVFDIRTRLDVTGFLIFQGKKRSSGQNRP